MNAVIYLMYICIYRCTYICKYSDIVDVFEVDLLIRERPSIEQSLPIERSDVFIWLVIEEIEIFIIFTAWYHRIKKVFYQ